MPARARDVRTPEAYDLVASLFPDTPEAEEARTAASRLREAVVLDSDLTALGLSPSSWSSMHEAVLQTMLDAELAPVGASA